MQSIVALAQKERHIGIYNIYYRKSALHEQNLCPEINFSLFWYFSDCNTFIQSKFQSIPEFIAIAT